jgi:hypothetical protein
MGKAASLVKLVTGNKNCKWIYRFRANPGRPWGGIVPPSPVLAPGRRSGRVPALPYPPPRSPQCTPEHYDYANPSFSALARRRAFAVASFCLRAAQIASARPASLSAGVI